jgi:hypothetical protein
MGAALLLEAQRCCGTRHCCTESCCEGAEPLSGTGKTSSLTIKQEEQAQDQDQTCSSCIFCGTLISPTTPHNKRKRSLSSLASFVSLRCQPTPYAYQYFSGVRGEQRVLLCISCVNWQRRACGQGKRTSSAKPGKKPLLFLDQFALFMLQPGTVVFPDQRCVLRLLQALKRDKEDHDRVPQLLMGLLPVPVQVMVSSLSSDKLTGTLPEGTVFNAMVWAWWEYNGQTPFFSHHLTAKLVRRVIKAAKEGKDSL